MDYVVTFLLVVLYFLPAFIAGVRDHRNVGPILVLNIFLGWTFLGWVAALCWCVSDNVRRA